LLNVGARNISAYADDPEHFVGWAQAHFSSSVSLDDYLPRPVYGHYVAAQVKEAARLDAEHFRCIRDEVVGLIRHDETTELILSSGQATTAHKVVLALGNFPPQDMTVPGKQPGSTRLLNNSWSGCGVTYAPDDKAVLLIGSGLTSVDVAVELRGRSFQGTIHVLSRRGLLPQRHQLVPPLATPTLEEAPRTARGLMRMIRRRVKAGEKDGAVLAKRVGFDASALPAVLAELAGPRTTAVP